MASAGQALIHARQFIHFSFIIFALLSIIIIALDKHSFTHAPQPKQSSVSIFGKDWNFCLLLFSDGFCLTRGILHEGHINVKQGTPRL